MKKIIIDNSSVKDVNSWKLCKDRNLYNIFLETDNMKHFKPLTQVARELLTEDYLNILVYNAKIIDSKLNNATINKSDSAYRSLLERVTEGYGSHSNTIYYKHESPRKKERINNLRLWYLSVIYNNIAAIDVVNNAFKKLDKLNLPIRLKHINYNNKLIDIEIKSSILHLSDYIIDVPNTPQIIKRIVQEYKITGTPSYNTTNLTFVQLLIYVCNHINPSFKIGPIINRLKTIINDNDKTISSTNNKTSITSVDKEVNLHSNDSKTITTANENNTICTTTNNSLINENAIIYCRQETSDYNDILDTKIKALKAIAKTEGFDDPITIYDIGNDFIFRDSIINIINYIRQNTIRRIYICTTTDLLNDNDLPNLIELANKYNCKLYELYQF